MLLFGPESTVSERTLYQIYRLNIQAIVLVICALAVRRAPGLIYKKHREQINTNRDNNMSRYQSSKAVPGYCISKYNKSALFMTCYYVAL
jgi:hypothetical protein